MPQKTETLEKIVMTRMMRLNATVTGFVTGTLAGLGLFIATLWLVAKGGEVVGPHLSLLGQFFWGYTVTFGGSFVGLGYGFLVGFLAGYAVAWLYNLFLRWRE